MSRRQDELAALEQVRQVPQIAHVHPPDPAVEGAAADHLRLAVLEDREGEDLADGRLHLTKCKSEVRSFYTVQPCGGGADGQS
ncbi:hypothetical protein GCM10027068_48490 [Prescottella soli]